MTDDSSASPTGSPSSSTSGSLADHRFVYLAPESGAGGVGFYADKFTAALAPHVGEFIAIRHGAPGTDTVADLRERRRLVRELIDTAPTARTIVHAEISGGSVESFWPTAFLGGTGNVIASATVHDPPGLVWWPARTRFLAEHKLLNHGWHFPTRLLTRRLERRVVGDRTLFVLTAMGADSVAREYPRAHVHHAHQLARIRPDIPAAPERPRAVGLFGLVYRGKGFEHIERLRSLLPADVAIRVAGRGTESLPAIDGVEVLGGLDDEGLDRFFASIRLLLVPYGRRSPYGEAFPGSAVVTDAISYRTPVVCTDHGALLELAAEGGVEVVRVSGDDGEDRAVEDIARAALEILDDPVRLDKLSAAVDAMRTARLPENVIRTFVQGWRAAA